MGKTSEGTYKERMQLWKQELLNDKAQHENAIKSNLSSVRLMQQSSYLHQKQIDNLDKELEFADKELGK